MADGYVLSENAKRQMRDVYRFYQDHRSAPPAAPDWPANTEPPRSIIVKTPAGGIAARSGTTVSSASCDVFKIVSGTLTDSTINVTVFNTSPSKIEGSIYILANQERYGDWIADGAGGSGTQQAQVIHFSLAGALTTSTASVASCTVNDAWGGESPGATVTIYNPEANNTTYIFEGSASDEGIAYYDPDADKYWIIQLECA